MGSSLSWQTDVQLHDAVRSEIEWDPQIGVEEIAVIACERVITLTGTARSDSARRAVEQAVKRVRGVRGIVNNIQVARLSTGRLKAKIDAALVHCADVAARRVEVSIDGPIVTLSGRVSSLHEKQEAERAARTADGVTHVENLITVGARKRGDAATRRRALRGQRGR